MGKRGFEGQPAEIAKLKGVYRPSRHGEIEGKVNLEYLSAVPEPPEQLNEHGSKFWFDMLNQLLKVNGLIRIPDLPTFQLMAYKWQVWNECAEKLKVQGMWIVNDRGIQIENPVMATMEKAEKIFISLSREFGCTPSARNNLKIPKDDDKKDPLSDFSL